MSLSRRALGATIATATLALVAACGGEADGVSTASPGGGGFPVTIEHKFGANEITAKPAKVVVVGLVEQDALLALGTVHWFGDNEGEIWPWAQDSLGGGTVPTSLDSTDGIQFEQIAALQPDLIVGMCSDVSQEDYDKLTRIAPTLPALKDTDDGGDVYLADGSDDGVTSTLGSATSFVTVLSAPYLIENLVLLIAQAADGDASTPVADESA